MLFEFFLSSIHISPPYTPKLIPPQRCLVWRGGDESLNDTTPVVPKRSLIVGTAAR